MPRIRSIHPDICDDEVVAELSPYAFRTWVLLWTHLDDDGRGLDSPKLWAGKLYPLNDKMTTERVEKDLSELEERGLLIRYEVDGKRLLTCKPGAWKQWQKPQHPTKSKLSAPPPEALMSGSRVAPVGVVGSGVEGSGEDGASPGSCGKGGAALAARAARHATSPLEDFNQGNEAGEPDPLGPRPQPIDYLAGTS